MCIVYMYCMYCIYLYYKNMSLAYLRNLYIRPIYTYTCLSSSQDKDAPGMNPGRVATQNHGFGKATYKVTLLHCFVHGTGMREILRLDTPT